MLVGGTSLKWQPSSILSLADWQLWGDDAIDDGSGNVLSWPARVGPSAIPLAPFPPPTIVTRADLNNRRFVRFDRALTNALQVNGDVDPVAGDHTFVCFCVPTHPTFEDPANNARSYITSANNAGSTRLLFPQTANDQRVATSHRYVGFFTGSADGDTPPNPGWHNFTRPDKGNPYAFSVAGPQCMTTVLDQGGTSYFYRDGVLQGSNVFYITPRAFYKGVGGRHTIGVDSSAAVVGDPTAFGGDIGAIFHFRVPIDAIDQAALWDIVSDYYNWVGLPYALPNEWGSPVTAGGMTGWYSSSKNIRAGVAVPDLVTWPDLLGFLGMTGSMSSAGGIANFVQASANKLTRNTAMSNWVAAAGYTVIVVPELTNVSQNSATFNLNALSIGDQDGRWGLHFRNNAGTIQAQGYHTDGTPDAAVATVLLSPNRPVIVWRYDGTNISISVNGGAPVTVAQGNINVLTGLLRIGGRTGTNVVDWDSQCREIALWNRFWDDVNVAQMLPFFNAMAAA